MSGLIVPRSVIATDATRRGFLMGAAATLVAAPSIVRAASLMNLRGLPLSQLLEFMPCDGRWLSVAGHGDIYKHIGHRYELDYHGPLGPGEIAPPRGRFQMPDLSVGFDFDVGTNGHVGYELDRNGELFMSVTPASSFAKDKIRNGFSPGGPFDGEQIDALLNGGRIKL